MSVLYSLPTWLRLHIAGLQRPQEKGKITGWEKDVTLKIINTYFPFRSLTTALYYSLWNVGYSLTRKGWSGRGLGTCCQIERVLSISTLEQVPYVSWPETSSHLLPCCQVKVTVSSASAVKWNTCAGIAIPTWKSSNMLSKLPWQRGNTVRKCSFATEVGINKLCVRLPERPLSAHVQLMPKVTMNYLSHEWMNQ